MYLKIICAMNILAVISYSIYEALRSDNWATTILYLAITLSEFLTLIWVLSGKIK